MGIVIQQGITVQGGITIGAGAVPVSIVNGSAQFSGSNYLSVPNNVALNPGTGSFNRVLGVSKLNDQQC